MFSLLERQLRGAWRSARPDFRGLRETAEAFYEPLGLTRRQAAGNQTIPVACTLKCPAPGKPVQGRLEILAVD